MHDDDEEHDDREEDDEDDHVGVGGGGVGDVLLRTSTTSTTTTTKRSGVARWTKRRTMRRQRRTRQKKKKKRTKKATRRSWSLVNEHWLASVSGPLSFAHPCHPLSPPFLAPSSLLPFLPLLLRPPLRPFAGFSALATRPPSLLMNGSRRLAIATTERQGELHSAHGGATKRRMEPEGEGRRGDTETGRTVSLKPNGRNEACDEFRTGTERAEGSDEDATTSLRPLRDPLHFLLPLSLILLPSRFVAPIINISRSPHVTARFCAAPFDSSFFTSPSTPSSLAAASSSSASSSYASSLLLFRASPPRLDPSADARPADYK